LESYANETDYTVWAEIDAAIGTIANCVERTDYKEKFAAFIRKLYKNIADKVGWNPKSNESHTDAMLRPLVLGRLGRSGDESVLKEARQRFKNYIEGKEDMVPDLRGMVFGLIGKYDGEAGQKELIGIFEKSDFSEVQRQAVSSIGRSTDPELQKRALDYNMSGKVRLQDLPWVFIGMCTTATGQETSWNFFKANFDKLIEKYGSAGNPLLGYILKFSCQSHCTEEKAKEIEEYFKKNDFTVALHRPVKQSLESVYLNVGLLKRDAEKMKSWLTNKGF